MKLAAPIAFLSVLCALLFAGCASSKLYRYEDMDLSEKSITVPPGGGSVMAEIKMQLKNEGWNVLVRRGPDVTDKGESKEHTYRTYETRYSLAFEEEIIRNGYGDKFTEHGISVIDNQTSREVFFIKSTSDSTSYIVRKFMDALNERAPASQNASDQSKRTNKR